MPANTTPDAILSDDFDVVMSAYSKWLKLPENHLLLERNKRRLRKLIHKLNVARKRGSVRRDSHRQRYYRSLNRA